MILYHGSNVEVSKPIIITTLRGRDFGNAFYLTPIKEQAERMAIRKFKQEKQGTPTVSVFEWDENKIDYKYKVFNNPDLEWLELIIKCRSLPNYKHEYEIVEGKIADDSVGETVQFVLEGIISKEDAIERLKFQKINSQIAFCNDNSLNSLTFIKSYEVKQ